MVIRLSNHVCGSLKHSTACFTFQCLFSIPVWFSLSLSIAQIFSSCVNRELIGLSGMKSITQLPTTTVMRPIIKKRICHEVKTLPV